MHEVHVGMLGGRGVGKTSLLTVMWHCFSDTTGRVDLELTPDPKGEAKLQKRLGELRSFPDAVKEGGVGVWGTDTRDHFDFELGRRAKAPNLKIVFHDYPGEFLADSAAGEDIRWVQELASRCAAVLVPVDAPALMEQNGRWHERHNRPSQIGGILKRAYRELQSPRLLVLAPVRCEKYLQEGRGEELLQTLTREYRELLGHLDCTALRDRVAVVVTPIQTVGAVQFSRVELDGDEPVFRFKKVKYDAPFQPVDSEQILCYLLRFLFRLHLQHKRWGVPILDWLQDWLGRDAYLKKAIETFAERTKTAPPFSILQGEQLLLAR